MELSKQQLLDNLTAEVSASINEHIKVVLIDDIVNEPVVNDLPFDEMVALVDDIVNNALVRCLRKK